MKINIYSEERTKSSVRNRFSKKFLKNILGNHSIKKKKNLISLAIHSSIEEKNSKVFNSLYTSTESSTE